MADESVPEEDKTTNPKGKTKRSKKLKFRPAFDLDCSYWGRLYENLERHPKPKRKDAEEHPSFWYRNGVDDTRVDNASDESVPSDNEEENEASPVSWFDASNEKYENDDDTTDIIVGESIDIIYRPNESVSSVKEEHSIEDLRALLNSQPDTYKRCQIKLEGPHLAICKILEEGHTHEEIEIHGRGKCGRTFSGDEVVVEIIHRGSNGKDDKGGDNDKMYGRVTGILYSKFKKTDFIVMACTSNTKEIHLMNPICNSIPKISVWRHYSRQNIEQKNYIDVYKVGDDGRLSFSNKFEIVPEKRRRYLFLVVYLLWRPEFTYPQGAVVQVLDCGKNFKSYLDVLNTHFQVPRFYGKKTVSHVSELIESPDIRTPTDTEDIRHMTVFTIDNAGSRVLDDALSVWKTERNGVDVLLVGVHITDVTSVVTKGSAVDQEAEKRATSYFASERKGNYMMPEPLSRNILSLVPNCDRFVISVFFVMDEKGNELEKPFVARRFIRSCRMFSYEEVQAIIDHSAGLVYSQTLTLESNVLTLHILARHMRKKRLKNSRFEASLADANENRDARHLVEEFMIKTNLFIASYLMDAFRHCVPLRCQADPPEDKLKFWVTRQGYVKDFLVKLQDRSILDSVCDIDNQVENNSNTEVKYISVQKAVWDEILKAVDLQDFTKVRDLMCCDVKHPLQGLAIEHWVNIGQTAAYRCSSEGKKNTSHFSLNMFPYTHFTSPLRRYTDLITHRLVHAVLDKTETPYTQAEVSKLCDLMTEKYQRKKEFDHSYRITRKCKTFAKSPCTFNAIVENVNAWKVTLYIPSLRGISFGRLELSFNLLDCSRNPKLKTLPSGKKGVLCFWNKRFYRYEEPAIADRRLAADTFELAEEEHVGQEQHTVCRSRSDVPEGHVADTAELAEEKHVGQEQHTVYRSGSDVPEGHAADTSELAEEEHVGQEQHTVYRSRSEVPEGHAADTSELAEEKHVGQEQHTVYRSRSEVPEGHAADTSELAEEKHVGQEQHTVYRSRSEVPEGHAADTSELAEEKHVGQEQHTVCRSGSDVPEGHAADTSELAEEKHVGQEQHTVYRSRSEVPEGHAADTSELAEEKHVGQEQHTVCRSRSDVPEGHAADTSELAEEKHVGQEQHTVCRSRSDVPEGHVADTSELFEEEHVGQEQHLVYRRRSEVPDEPAADTSELAVEEHVVYRRRSDVPEEHTDDISGERFETSGENHIDTNLHTAYIPSFQFAQFLKEVFKIVEKEEEDICKSSICCTEGRQRLASGLWSLIPSAKYHDVGTRRLVSSASDGEMAWHYIEFSHSFSPGQVVRVQIHAAADRGLPAPYVQLFHICDNFDLCLNHMDDPVAIFADYVSVSVKDRTFLSIDEYQNAWLPVLEMESAKTSVGNEQTIVIDDVEVTIVTKIFNRKEIHVGTISLDQKFCDDRQIDIGGRTVDTLGKMEPGENSYSDLNYASLDYLCIRHAVDEGVWVGHAVVKKIKLRKPVGRYVDIDPDAGTVIVTFELRRNSRRPPRMLINKPFGATVEIIPKSLADRRTAQMIVALKPQGDYLAKNIALSRTELLNSRNWCRRLELCMQSPTDLTDEERHSSTMIINNENQTKAIRRALQYPFSLIQGPPGTGKTTIGVKLVFLFDKINKQMFAEGCDKKRKQVLFCGPSNKSVDLVARSILKKLGKDIRPKILRVYGRSVEQEDFPVPLRLSASNKRRKILKSDPELKEATLHHVIRENEKPHASQIRKYDERFSRYLRSSAAQREKVTLDDLKAYDKLITDAEKEELESYDVILCTCIAAGGRSLRNAITIHQVIIDESGMCTEPQTMVPIIGNTPEQVVLIGDHRQLRPIVQCKAAAELGLDQSLFQRYRSNVAFLNIQYRMHPEICRFPKNQFYLGKLETGPSNEEEADWYIAPGKELSNIWPVKTNPKVFCHVKGEEETLTVTTQDGNEMSKSNEKEAEKLVEVFMYLVHEEQIPVKDINLMTQYNAQRSLIERKLEGKLTSTQLEDLTVQTVVASQGSEWDYVIFSTVRSLPHYKIESSPTLGWSKYNLGFITDANQINVALTRARKGLIIIGNYELLRCDNVLKQLIAMYKKEGCFVESANFPPNINYRRYRQNVHPESK